MRLFVGSDFGYSKKIKHMKKIILLILAVVALSQANAQPSPFFKEADAFLKKHVSNGLVDYESLKKESGDLEKLVNMIKSEPYLKGDEEKAFLINAYNILAIRTVVESMPMDNPTKVIGFFEKEAFAVHEARTSLNKLEKEMLYAKFKDPLLHLVLVCAAKGCPKLPSKAYMPQNLSSQLEEQAATVINEKGFIRVDKSGQLQLSEIFEWYLEDFGGKKGMMDFITKYYNGKIQDPKNYGHYEYDWSLNTK
jgi:hypothetical protein